MCSVHLADTHVCVYKWANMAAKEVTTGELLSCKMYAYCIVAPVNRVWLAVGM